MLYTDWGFFEEPEPDSQWEEWFLQALAAVFAPDLKPSEIDPDLDLSELFGYRGDHPALLEKFHRLSGFTLKFDPTCIPKSLGDLRRFLKLAAPDIYPTQPTLPAIVIGNKSIVANRPGWLHFIWHQYGGYATDHEYFCGAILPLHLNRFLAKCETHSLFQAFDAMAEDPDRETLRKHYPSLFSLAATHGDRYTDEQQSLLFNFVSKYFDLPKFTEGCEALIQLENCNPMKFFSGWQMPHIAGEKQSSIEFTLGRYEELRSHLGPNLKYYLMWLNSD